MRNETKLMHDEVRRCVAAASNMTNDLIEQAIDQLVCQGVDFDRMCLVDEAGLQRSIRVDGATACTLSSRVAVVGGEAQVVFALRWVNAFDHLNPKPEVT